MSPHIPNSLFSVLELAAILVFTMTTLAAIISVFITKRNGLIYLGSQTALLFFMLFLSRDWVQPLFFRNPLMGLRILDKLRFRYRLFQSLLL